jgi:hypothetical protein
LFLALHSRLPWLFSCPLILQLLVFFVDFLIEQEEKEEGKKKKKKKEEDLGYT